MQARKRKRSPTLVQSKSDTFPRMQSSPFVPDLFSSFTLFLYILEMSTFFLCTFLPLQFAYKAKPKENAFVKGVQISSAPSSSTLPPSFAAAAPASPITPTPFFSPRRAIAETFRVPWPKRFRSFSSSVAASFQLSQCSTTTSFSSSLLVVDFFFFLPRFFLAFGLFSSSLSGKSRPGGGPRDLRGGLALMV